MVNHSSAHWYLGRESNPNLSLRRTLFYPLNYQGRNTCSRISDAKIIKLFANFKCRIAILITKAKKLLYIYKV